MLLVISVARGVIGSCSIGAATDAITDATVTLTVGGAVIMQGVVPAAIVSTVRFLLFAFLGVCRLRRSWDRGVLGKCKTVQPHRPPPAAAVAQLEHDATSLHAA
jgi:hypothetical protein